MRRTAISLLSSVVLLALAGGARAQGVDFTPQAKALFRIAACGGSDPLPAGVDAKVVERHCKDLEAAVAKYKARWVDKAVPVLSTVVPADVPKTVVYPFGGGDLVTALATYPNATELTTMSLELGGDPRPIDRVRGGALKSQLDVNRENVRRLFAVAHSKTTNLTIVSRGDLPGQLIFVLTALKVHGWEPVKLRYFTVQSDGSLHYLTQEDITAGETAAKAQKNAKLAAQQVFSNFELVIKKEGREMTFRHMAANLDDAHLAETPGLIKHLEAKGRIAAMTKAASYLLWWKNFSTIRNYLLGHMDFMISDSTGIPPSYAKPAGFAQETWGVFEGPFLPAGRTWGDEMVALWKTNPKKALDFRYGYPDSDHHSHMMVTRRAK